MPSPTKVLQSQHQCAQLIDSIGIFTPFSPIHHRRDTQPVHAVGGLLSSENVTWGACLIHVDLPALGINLNCQCYRGPQKRRVALANEPDFLMREEGRLGKLVLTHVAAQLVFLPVLGHSTMQNDCKIADEIDKVLARDLKSKHLLDYASPRNSGDGLCPPPSS